jgi:hypothetical protein
METVIEHRNESRTSLSWPVSIWLPEANRFFYGRSRDVSKTGVFITVPLPTPIKAGNSVELNFPRTEKLAKEKGGYARIKSGKVVRVEREKVLKEALVGFAVQFN